MFPHSDKLLTSNASQFFGQYSLTLPILLHTDPLTQLLQDQQHKGHHTFFFFCKREPDLSKHLCYPQPNALNDHALSLPLPFFIFNSRYKQSMLFWVTMVVDVFKWAQSGQDRKADSSQNQS